MLVNVLFDVEDLVHEDSDDIPLHIADMLADEGVVASMCVVGEKARLWERRGRGDVIAAVGMHDVLLHTDHHSVHPTVSEYLADKGWADGVAEAMAQEGRGKQDLARMFGAVPSSWGTSGSSWAPQIPAATRLLGIPSHVYSHVRSGESGACWFAGQLCFPDYASLHGGETACCDEIAFAEALPRLLGDMERGRERGASHYGLFAGHPTRFRYTEFWDAINFSRGVNTPPEAYRAAPRRDDAGYQTGLANLRRMVLAVGDLPGIELTSTRELNQRFAPESRPLEWADVRGLAQTVAASETIRTDGPLASPAQALDLLARAALRLHSGGPAPAFVPLRMVLGPVEASPVLERAVALDAGATLALCRGLVAYVDEHGCLPVSLPCDGGSVGPGPLLGALARAFLALDSGQPVGQLTLQTGADEPACAGQLAQDAIFGPLPHWPPHAPDLRLDLLALHTRLQSWSLKPAVQLR